MQSTTPLPDVHPPSRHLDLLANFKHVWQHIRIFNSIHFLDTLCRLKSTEQERCTPLPWGSAGQFRGFISDAGEFQSLSEHRINHSAENLSTGQSPRKNNKKNWFYSVIYGLLFSPLLILLAPSLKIRINGIKNNNKHDLPGSYLNFSFWWQRTGARKHTTIIVSSSGENKTLPISEQDSEAKYFFSFNRATQTHGLQAGSSMEKRTKSRKGEAGAQSPVTDTSKQMERKHNDKTWKMIHMCS